MRILDILARLEEHYPTALACEWDNVGLLAGDGEAACTGIQLALDVTDAAIDQAVRNGANLIVTHHPVIFRPIKALTPLQPVYRAVQRGLAIISFHTNLDIATGGVNDCLAAAVGVTGCAPLCADGLGRVGMPHRVCGPADYARHVRQCLGAGGVRCAPGSRTVQRVAICSGAGGDLVDAAVAAGADTLLVGEAKYNEFLYARQRDVTLIAAGHYATEVVVLPALKEVLAGTGPIFLTDEQDVEVFL